MRNLKKLSLAFLLTTLFSISFTSCIDTDVDPAVEAIYAAQADLIAAQTAVQNAEADYLAAQAAAEQADADYRAAQTAQLEVQTAGYEADNAYEALQREQYLLALVASTNLQVAQSQNALEIANANFEIQMAQLMAQLEAAGVQLAMNYANSYANAMNQANSLYSQLLAAQNNLANAELMQESTSGFSYAYYLAGLQGAVDNAVAAKAVIEGNIADLEATIADPSTLEAGLTELKDEKAALEASRDDLDVQIADQAAVIADLINQNDEIRTDLIDRIDMTQLENHNDAVDGKNDRVDWIEGLQEDIDDWQMLLDDYATTEATLQTAVDDAQTAFDAAETAYDDAVDASDDADDVAAAALIVRDDLVDALALLDAAYQTAIANLAAEQALYDAGLVGATAAVTTAQANYDAQVAAILVAQADYDAKKAAFDADYAGFVWTAGPDGALGIHADAITATDSYYVVNATNDGVDALTLTVGTGADQTGVYGTYAAFLADATAGSLATGDFYNVGADDVAGGTNADRLDAALVELTTQEGLLPALATALEDAEDDLANFGDDLAAATEEYLAQQAFYEDGEADLEAAELALTAADDAAADAQDDEDDALDAKDDAQDDLDDAQDDLDTFLLTTEAMIQADIDDANDDIAMYEAEIVQLDQLIAALYAEVAGMFAQLDEAGIAYTFTVNADGTGTLEFPDTGIFTGYDIDIQVLLIEARQVAWNLQFDRDALTFEIGQMTNMITAYENAYGTDDVASLVTALGTAQASLPAAMDAIELAEQALASGQVEEEAATALIGYYQALVDAILAQHANQLAIAAEYEALMLAALGN